MKVLLLNGSPHEHGCTYTALKEMADELENSGIGTEIFWIGQKAVSGCIACRKCFGVGKCALGGNVNEFIDKAADFDGFVFGSPVHFASVSGAISAFLDRVFYAGKSGGVNPFRLKPAACIVSARRAGTTAALDQLNKYATISEMPLVSSRYWNMVHGNTPDEVKKDVEGMQAMRILARNMAYLLHCRRAADAAGISLPQTEKPTPTNFIR